MKKLMTLTFALLFTAGIALGQNTATTNQSGDGNDANIDQVGSNTADVIQSQSFGGGNTADVNQDGISNMVHLEQSMTSSEATLTQNGESNEIRLKQAGYNVSTVTMNGDGNILGGYNDYAGTAFQKNGTGYFPAGLNEFSVDVTGDGNKIGLNQEANAKAVDIAILGSRNQTNIRQKGENGGAVSTASVDINTGNDNMIDIFQGGNGPGIGGNSATVEINMGDLNNVDIDQLTAGNTATATINGMNNQSIVIQ